MWAYQWKMSFNPDVSKQDQEVIFSKKTSKPFHPSVHFNNVPHVDQCDNVYDQPENDSFMDKLEQVQYDATLAITGAIKCTSCSKLYKELGHQSLESRRRFRCLCVLRKIVSN